MAEPQYGDLRALVEILGHNEGCHQIEHDKEDAECRRWECDDYCDSTYDQCGVWKTAKALLTTKNLNTLLSKAWSRGYSACAVNVANELLALLPQHKDVPNPYEETPSE